MDEKVAIGDVLAGKYRVEKVLGSGGMGVVVAARHEQLDVLVALKFMTDEAFEDRGLVARFLREARAAARLRSEHVARVTDVGRLESGAPYQVMEYLEGSDLSVLLANEGPLPVSAAVDYVAQACDALDEAHGAGIIHRDIKPSNLFRTTRPNGTVCIKVLDFGISKSDCPGGSSTKLHGTHSGAVLGSPFYMAPEQMRSARDVDARADVWALGATLYELLTGRVPFEAESLLDLALQIAQSDPRPPRGIRAEIPWALEQVILRCLEKDREGRPSSARSLALALGPFALRGAASLRGVVSRTEWGTDTAMDSSEANVTRVARAPSWAETAGEVDPPSREAEPRDLPESPICEETQVSEGQAPVPRAAPALPMPLAVQGSLPPTTRSAPPAWRTGGRLSWGRSQRSSGKYSRAIWVMAALGTLGGAAAALLLRSTVIPVRFRATASLPVPTTGTGASKLSATSPSAPPVLEASAEPAPRIPIVSVADLPTAALSPTATPLVSPPTPVPHASPARGPSNGPPSPGGSAATDPNCVQPYFFNERGIKKFRVECLESWQSAVAATPSAQGSSMGIAAASADGSPGDAAAPMRAKVKLERDNPWPSTL
jgi:serine/threonine protein kinase